MSYIGASSSSGDIRGFALTSVAMNLHEEREKIFTSIKLNMWEHQNEVNERLNTLDNKVEFGFAELHNWLNVMKSRKFKKSNLESNKEDCIY